MSIGWIQSAGPAGATGEDDVPYDQGVEVVPRDRKGSVSYVQPRLEVGYNVITVVPMGEEEE